MPLKSMTGFGRAEGTRGATSWTWEARSVNGRGLDVRLRLPPGLDALEPKARDAVQTKFARGSVNITLSLQRLDGAAEIRLNPGAVAAVSQAVAQFKKMLPDAIVSIDGLLSLRGVLDYAEPVETEAETELRNAAILASLDAALKELIAARDAEGRRLETVLRDSLAEVERLTAEVAASPARAPVAIQARLTEQIERLTGQAGLDPARLHQEAMLIATRIDVEEELKRLASHSAAARELLAAKEPVGRKFDFLTQEFNREANTLCSKANDPGITRAGLALKAVIDQMREQVQNIE